MTIARRSRIRPPYRVLAALATLFLLFAPSVFAGEFAGIVFFGDSLTDPGNHFEEYGMMSRQPFIPDPDYPYAIGGHHFSNGATWAEQLARRMKMPTGG